MDIGFVGLGNMGSGITQNLLKAGRRVTVWNRTKSRAEALKQLGARIAATPGEAAKAGIVMTMLADDKAVESVVYGEGGILRSLPADGLHISLSTISVALSERLTKDHRDAGQQYVAAPVFGRPEAAAAAKLFVVAAGSPGALGRCKTIFEMIGQQTFFAGDVPNRANTIKLAGNFLISSMLQGFGEAFALARKSGIEAEKLLEILTGTVFVAPYQKGYGSSIARGVYEPAGFTASLGLKDVRLVLAAADAAGVPMPMASLVHDRFQTALGRGHGAKDWSVIARLAAEDAGL